MDDIAQDPAVTDNSISVNYIKDDQELILVITLETDQGTTIDRVTVTDPGARVVFLTTVKPVVWNTLSDFDRWYALYDNLNRG